MVCDTGNKGYDGRTGRPLRYQSETLPQALAADDTALISVGGVVSEPVELSHCLYFQSGSSTSWGCHQVILRLLVKKGRHGFNFLALVDYRVTDFEICSTTMVLSLKVPLLQALVPERHHRMHPFPCMRRR